MPAQYIRKRYNPRERLQAIEALSSILPADEAQATVSALYSMGYKIVYAGKLRFDQPEGN